MSQKQYRPQNAWKVLWRAPVRALLLGVLASAAGGLFAASCAALLCLAAGFPWTYAAWWGLRGAFAGLAAGAIIGAVSGFYHVEEPVSAPAPHADSPREAPPTDGAPLPARPAAAVYRNGVRPGP